MDGKDWRDEQVKEPNLRRFHHYSRWIFPTRENYFSKASMILESGSSEDGARTSLRHRETEFHREFNKFGALRDSH